MRNIVLVVCCLSVITSIPAQTVHHLDDRTMDDIDAAVLTKLVQYGLPGISIAVIYNGRVAYTKAYGIAAPNVNATTSTKYPIASVSKTVTGILAMKMVENGDIALNDQISDYVSGYNNSGITIRHLLSHQSGIGHYNNCPDGYDGNWNFLSSLSVVQGCARCMGPPGSGTIYSTFLK
jgi:CubicO group peptidase (beta-lactamase class C family)